jgi:hypothetical protein
LEPGITAFYYRSETAEGILYTPFNCAIPLRHSNKLVKGIFSFPTIP